MLDRTAPMSCIHYRIAYGEAARPIERAIFGPAWFRNPGRRIGIHSQNTLAEVLPRTGGHDVDVVTEGLEDALLQGNSGLNLWRSESPKQDRL